MVEHWHLLGQLDNLVDSRSVEAVVFFLSLLSFLRPRLVHEVSATGEQYDAQCYQHHYISLDNQHEAQKPKSLFVEFMTATLSLLRIVNERIAVYVPAYFGHEHEDEEEEIELHFRHSWVFGLPPEPNQNESPYEMARVDDQVPTQPER